MRRLLLVLLCLLPVALHAQQRPRPQYQCGAQPSLDSITTAGSKWLACEHAYWSSVYRAAKMLSRYSGIDGNCLTLYSEVYADVARAFYRGAWAEANTAKSGLTCAAGRQVRIDSEAISLLCTNERWTPDRAMTINCPDPMAQNEQVNTTGSYEELPDGYSLMVRNNSAARTVKITEWTVYDCTGVRGSVCARHTRPVIIGPGQMVELGRVIKEPGRAFSFQWNYQAEFLE